MKETKTNNAPAAIGPYSQAITVGNMLFTSGQIPINPATGDIPEGVEAQAEQALTNVKNLIEAAGGSIEIFYRALSGSFMRRSRKTSEGRTS